MKFIESDDRRKRPVDATLRDAAIRVEVMGMPTEPATASATDKEPAPPASAHDGLIEIVLPGGVTVRVDARVDGGALRRVLAALTVGQLSTLLEGCEWRTTARNLRPELAG